MDEGLRADRIVNKLPSLDDLQRREIAEAISAVEADIIARLTKMALLQVLAVLVPGGVALFILGGINERVERGLSAITSNQEQIRILSTEHIKMDERLTLTERWAEDKGMRPSNVGD